MIVMKDANADMMKTMMPTMLTAASTTMMKVMKTMMTSKPTVARIAAAIIQPPVVPRSPPIVR